MKVSGFTILKNAVKNNYPFIESIKSLLPLVDEFIINVADDDNETYQNLLELNEPKINIFKNKWDIEKSKKGEELANQTNIALLKCTGDWAFYLQADEVIHENDYDKIYSSMKKNLSNKNIKGLMFNYYHFYYNYNIINCGMYKRQIRIIRNDGSVKSIKDACGFGYNGSPIKEYKFWLWRHTGACIYHYGWIYEPVVLEERKRSLGSFWKSETNLIQQKNNDKYIEFDFRLCKAFKKKHPSVMKERIENTKTEIKNLPKLPILLRPYYYRRKIKKIFGI